MQSLLKASIAVGLLAAAGTSFAQVTLFNSPDTTSNAATRTNWLTAAGVALATFDDRNAFTPTEHIWLSEKMDWVRIDDGLKQYQESVPQ